MARTEIGFHDAYAEYAHQSAQRILGIIDDAIADGKKERASPGTEPQLSGGFSFSAEDALPVDIADYPNAVRVTDNIIWLNKGADNASQQADEPA